MDAREIKKELSHLWEKLKGENLIFPQTGNLSTRYGDKVIINTRTEDYQSTDEEFCIVNIDGVSLEEGKVPSAMTSVHCEILKKRNDVNLVMHWQGKYTEVLTSFEDELPMTPEVMFVVQSKIPVIPLKKVGSLDKFAEWQKENAKKIIINGQPPLNSFIIPVIGVWTVAKDIKEMYERIKLIEMTAEIVVHKKILAFTKRKLETKSPDWLLDLVDDYFSRKQ